ncbi:TetR/AcrR family transcriptional regulator [Cognatiyoonia sp. IB215446]|uniref:TetR/AcrR family transcriptional regulator n=1 Tax=Cognatiyoonia sp. IB215446 TaxID=3097355 RepID=UPI002A150DD5|nr:TetR/AcrR family transcriptional regulator [Cognatiyoonia sp. IB215446]MDX8347910.1 TetR/AcrR family transcriptional regulator [Cognatiyoonia sp. IB215446]
MTDTPKTKPRRRKEARPAEIVAAGIAEFATYGFERARLDRIAKAAGISKGTIYLYYPSKEALFLAAVEEHVIAVMAEHESALDHFEGTTGEILTQLLRGIYRRFVEGQAQTLFRILITEGNRIPHVLTSYHTMTIKRGASLLRRILERGIQRGEVANTAILENPQVMIAPAMFFALHNMMFSRIETLDFDTYFEAHVELILNGVISRPCPDTAT